MNKVIITDSIAPVCGEMLEAAGVEFDVHTGKEAEELKTILDREDYEGWIIRSGTLIGPALLDSAPGLRVIGRAGVGVDNVDLDAATRRGVLVLNAPDGNTISTAEHTCAMIMALARKIPSADASLTGGSWDRKSFSGSELYGKTLGIVGVGKIGREVAERMRAFGMVLLGFDPFLSSEVAARIGIEKVPIEQIWERSDLITFHTPLNDATRGILNKTSLSQCKPGVRIVNCARGGIVNESDLLDALNDGQVAGAALDVYSSEPPEPHLAELIGHPSVVSTPHIAASTEEAQEKVAVQVTEQVINALKGDPVLTPVNGAAIKLATEKEVQPYLDLAERLGLVVVQLSKGDIRSVSVTCYGELVGRYLEILTIAALKGVLTQAATQPVNYINARPIADDNGLEVIEARRASAASYANLVEVTVTSSTGARTLAGTVFDGVGRITRVDEYDLEVVPQGYLLLYTNVDRPGILASVSTVLAERQINIASLALGRVGPGAEALAVMTLDERVPAEILDVIGALPGLQSVDLVHV